MECNILSDTNVENQKENLNSMLFGNYSLACISLYNSIIDELNQSNITICEMDPESYFELTALWAINPQQVKDFNPAKVYYQETLDRTFTAALTGFLRGCCWIEGIKNSIAQENYFLFCSSVRGFLEASCTAIYSLSVVPTFLVDNIHQIKACLSGNFPYLVACEELENRLIHFQFASKKRKTKKKEKDVTASHTVKEYMNNDLIKSYNFYSIYQKLCEVVHPSQASLDVFLNRGDEKDTFEIEKCSKISQFITENGQSIKFLCEVTNSIFLSTIGILSKLDSKYRMQAIPTSILEAIPIWRKFCKENETVI